jgi:hypothetical protein
MSIFSWLLSLARTDKELKTARKKLKRLEIANRAAEKELAEISLEQQVLRELRVKHVQPTSDRDSLSKRAPSPPPAGSALSQQANGTTTTSITEVSLYWFCIDNNGIFINNLLKKIVWFEVHIPVYDWYQ